MAGGFLLSGVQCFQDLVSPAAQPVYIIEALAPWDASPILLNVGGDHPAPAVRLRAGADVVPVRFVAEVVSGTGIAILGNGRVAVSGPGVSTIRVRPISSALPTDTLMMDFQVRGVVPKLALTVPDTLFSINDTADLVATALSDSDVVISGGPVTWSLESGSANVRLLAGTPARIIALGNGDAVLKATSDTATRLDTVRVRQRAAALDSLSSVTLVAVGQTRVVGARVLDARSNSVAGATIAWLSRDAATVSVNPATGVVRAERAGSTRVVATATGPGGNVLPGASDSTTVTVTPARIAIVSGDRQTGSFSRALPLPLVAKLTDASGADVSEPGIAVIFEVTAGNGSVGTGRSSDTVLTDAQGRTSRTLTLGTGPGSVNQVTVTGIGLSGPARVFTGFAAPPAVLATTGQPGDVVAGRSISPAVTVEVRDTFGVRVPTAGDTIELRLNPSGLLQGSTRVAANAGVATFGNLVVGSVGTFRLIAERAGGGFRSDSSVAFQVTPDNPARVAFAVQPSSAPVSAAISPVVRVCVQDASGNLIAGDDNRDVTLTIATVPPGGTNILNGTTTQATAAGCATFNDLSIAAAARGYRLRAQSLGLASGTSTAFDIGVGVPDDLVLIGGNNQNAIGGTDLADSLVVQVLDATATGVAGDTVIFIVPAGDEARFGSLERDTAITDAAGRAAAQLTAGATAGSYFVTARSQRLGGAGVTFNYSVLASNLSLEFVVEPTNSSGGLAFSPRVQVRVKDAGGSTVTAATPFITLSVVPGTGSPGAVITGSATVRAAAGVATFGTAGVNLVGSGYRIRAAATGVAPDTSASFSVILGPAARVGFTAEPSGADAGAAIPAFRAAIQDAGGNIVAGYSGGITVSIASGSGTAGAGLSGTTQRPLVSGEATFTGISIDSAATSGYRLVAVESGNPGLTPDTSAAFVIQPAPAVRLAVRGPLATGAGPYTAGATLPSLVVMIQDSLGNTVPSSSIVGLAFGSNPSGATLNGTIALNAVAGVATFSDLRIRRAASGYTLTANSSGLLAASTVAFAVQPAPANRLAFVQQPGSVTAGALISPSVIVMVRDSVGNDVTADSGRAMSLAITPGTGTNGAALSGANAATAGGSAIFNSLAVDLPGTGYSLTASAPGVGDAISTAFDVIAASANRLLFQVTPGPNVTAGAPIAPHVRVAITNAQGQTIATATDPVTLAISPATGTAGAQLRGVVTVAAQSGIATFTSIDIDSAGTGYTLTATAPGGIAGATTPTFTVVPAAPSRLELVPGYGPGSREAGSVFSPPLQIAVKDAIGNLTSNTVTAVTMGVTAGTGTAGAILAGTVTQNSAGGIATFADLSINLTGAGYTLTATAPGGVSPVTSGTFSITSRPLSRVVVLPAGVAIPTPGGTQQLVAEGRDDLGNLVTGLTFTWSHLNPAVAEVSPAGLATGKAGGQTSVCATSQGNTGCAVVTVSAGALAPVNLIGDLQLSLSNIQGGWALSPSLVYAAGGNGSIFRYTGGSWQQVVDLGGAQLSAMWGSAANDIHAVGFSWRALHFDGGSWSPQFMPGEPGGVGTNHLRSLWGASPTEVFAGGRYLGGVFRYDGTTWTDMAIPDYGWVRGLWGSSSSNLFAVSENQSEVLRYDGSSWTLTPTGSPTGLFAVWGSAANNVFAVGGYGSTIMRFDGSGWSQMSAPPPTSTSGDILETVWGTSGSDVYAGFARGSGVLRFDGSSWSLLPATEFPYLAVNVIWGAPGGDMFLAANSGVARGFRGGSVALAPSGIVTLRSLGDTVRLAAQARDSSGSPVTPLRFLWTSSGSSATVDTTGLVTAVANGNTNVCATASGGAQNCVTIVIDQRVAAVVLATGSEALSGVGATATFSARDARGNPIQSPVAWSSLNDSVATAVPPGTVTARSSGQATISASAGGGIAYALVTVTIPGATAVNLWAAVNSGTSEHIRAFWGASASDVFAVGNNGSALRYNGTSWSPVSGLSGQFADVWGTSSTNVYAVGSDGIWHFNGASWSNPVQAPFGNVFDGVWGSSPADVYVGGSFPQGGFFADTIYHFDGTSWSQLGSGAGAYPLGHFRQVQALWGASATSVIAAQRSGAIVRFSGTGWQQEASSAQSLWGLWGWSSGNVFGVGESGAIGRLQGGSWSPMSAPVPLGGSGSPVPLNNIWGSADDDVYVVGDLGTILRYNGVWSLMSTGTSDHLYGVWGTSGGDVWAGGLNGRLLRGVRGATVAVTPANPVITGISGTTQLAAAAQRPGGQPLAGVTFNWSSSNDGIATVDGNGLVTAVAEGTVTITATAPGGAAGSTQVRVAVPTTLVVAPSGLSLSGIGGQAGMTAELRDGLGQVMPATFSWTGLNDSIVRIDSSTGIVTAIGAGQAIVSASAQGRTGFAVVTVSAAAQPINLWAPVTIGSTNFNYLWGTSSTNIFMSGTASKLMRYDGLSWSSMSSSAPGDLDDIWGSSPQDVYVVGASDYVGHFAGSGNTWTTVPNRPAVGASWFSIWGSSPSDVWIGGTGGNMLHFDGASWTHITPAQTGTTQAIAQLWGTARDNVYAAGVGGLLIHWNGSAWSPVSTGITTSQNLLGIWGSAPSNLLVVGDGATGLRFNGASWSAENTLLPFGHAIWGTSSTDAYAVGANAAADSSIIVRFDGGTWQRTSAGPYGIVNGIWGTSGGPTWAAGYAPSPLVLRGYRGASVTIDQTTPQITGGDTLQLSATLRDTLGSTISGVTISWSAANPAIATVTSSGLVTGVSHGRVDIIASAPGGAADTVSLRVYDEFVAALAAGSGGLRVFSFRAGAVLRTLTTNPADAEPRWSPDGSTVVFQRGTDIYTIDQAGATSPVAVLATGDVEHSPAWSPSGALLVAGIGSSSAQKRLVTMDLSGGNQTIRTTSAAGTTHEQADWSPDGTRILFQATIGSGDRNIQVLDVASGLVDTLAQSGAHDQQARYSPDGTKVVFVSARNGGDYEIYTMDADGQNQIRFTSVLQADFEPSWSPDGRWILWYSNRTSTSQLYFRRSTAAGAGQGTPLTNLIGQPVDPDWRPIP